MGWHDQSAIWGIAVTSDSIRPYNKEQTIDATRKIAMHQIQLDDHLFQEAQRRATAAGFATVDAYVADVLSHDPGEPTDNFDHLFTPEVLAELDHISGEIDAGGKTYSLEEVREHFEKKRTEWLKNQAS
jgi:hypothetical protein